MLARCGPLHHNDKSKKFKKILYLGSCNLAAPMFCHSYFLQKIPGVHLSFLFGEFCHKPSTSSSDISAACMVDTLNSIESRCPSCPVGGRFLLRPWSPSRVILVRFHFPRSPLPSLRGLSHIIYNLCLQLTIISNSFFFSLLSLPFFLFVPIHVP